MSMKYRDANGVETPVAGLNGTSGELVPSVSYYQSGNKTSDTTSWSTGETGTFSVNLSENMPNADYIVVPTLSVVGVSAIVHAKTVNSFRVTVRNDRAETITQAITLYWQAFKLMTDENRALDEQAIADIQAVVPANATSSNQLVPASTVADMKAVKNITVTSNSNFKGGSIIAKRIGNAVTVTLAGVSWNYTGQDTVFATGLPKAVQNWYQLCLNVAGNTVTTIVDTNGQLLGGLDAGVNVWHSFTYLTADE